MGNLMYNNGERLTYVNERLTLLEQQSGQSFGADAFLLAAYVKSTESAAADLGGGTGICSLLLADRKKASHIYSAEIQKTLHEAAVSNIRANRLDGMVTALNTDIRTLSAASFGLTVGTVIANPPYFPAVSGRLSPDPGKNAARFELNGSLEDFCTAAARILPDGGAFYCVLRPERLCDLIHSLNAASLSPFRMTFVCHKSSAAPSMVLVASKKNGRNGLCVTRPLFLYDASGAETADAVRIYKTCDFGGFFE